MIQIVERYKKLSTWIRLGLEQELTPKPYEDLAQLIKQTRTDQNISQRRLSAKINMSPGYTAQLESGKVQPSVKALRKLGFELGLPYETLAFLAKYTDAINLDNSSEKNRYHQLLSLGKFTEQEWNTILEFAGYIANKRETNS